MFIMMPFEGGQSRIIPAAQMQKWDSEGLFETTALAKVPDFRVPKEGKCALADEAVAFLPQAKQSIMNNPLERTMPCFSNNLVI